METIRKTDGPALKGESHSVEVVVSTRVNDPSGDKDYQVEVVNNELSWYTIVTFSSRKNRLSLLRDVAAVVFKSNDPFPVAGFRRGASEELELYLDSLEVIGEIDPEVRAFTLLLALDSCNPHADDLAKNLILARKHVAHWRKTKMSSEEDQRMFLDPLVSQWGYKTWLALHPPIANKRIVRLCEDEEYRELLVFLSLYLDFFKDIGQQDRSVGELLENAQTSNYYSSPNISFLDFPVHFPEFRTYLKSLSLRDLIFLRTVVDWENPTVKSSLGICQNILDGSVGTHSIALASTLAAMNEAVTGDREKMIERSCVKICEANSSSLESLALLEDFFSKVEGPFSIVDAHQVLMNVLGNVEEWGVNYSSADYLVGEIFRATGSSKKTIELISHLRRHDVSPSLKTWESYLENWESMKDISPVLVFSVLAAE